MYSTKMILLSLFILFVSNLSYSQSPTAPVWGVYASGVGEKLKPGMDPCWITYTVAFMSDPKIVANISYGTMGDVGASLTWKEASALRRTFGRYFDDKPDGIFKLTSCEIDLLDGRSFQNSLTASNGGTFSTTITFRHIEGNKYEVNEIGGCQLTGIGSLSGKNFSLPNWKCSAGSGNYNWVFNSDYSTGKGSGTNTINEGITYSSELSFKN